MKTTTPMFRKRILRMGIYTLVCIVLWTVVSATAQEHTFRLGKILRNEENSAVVAISVFGTFREEDIISIYTNNVFVKSKVIRQEEVGDAEQEVVIPDISTDIFSEGENTITAKVERRGVVVMEAAPLLLKVQSTPERPLVVVESQGDAYRIKASVQLQEGDIIRFFLNEAVIEEREVTEEEITNELAVSELITREQLTVGRNSNGAAIRRGSTEGDQGSGEVIEIEENIEEEKEEDMEEVPVSETPADKGISLLSCPVYSHKQTIRRADADDRAYFGRTMSMNNNVLLVSAGDYKTSVYGYAGTEWNLEGSIPETRYSKTKISQTAVAVDTDSLLIGVPNTNYHGFASGSVHRYRRVLGGWQYLDSLVPETLTAYSSFGGSIAVSDLFIIVGTSERNFSGSLYVFPRTGFRLFSPVQLIPSDSARNQHFGHSISVEGATIAVGAPGDQRDGAVYIYRHMGTAWKMEKIPAPPEVKGTFGKQILLKDGMLFITAERQSDTGMVYIYTFNGSTWQLVQTLSPPDDVPMRDFGAALAGARGVLVIGAPDSDSSVGRRTGAVYIYTNRNGSWQFDQEVVSQAVKSGDRFGAAVVFDGMQLAVAATHDDQVDLDAGAIYIYQVAPGVCAEETEVIVPEVYVPVTGNVVDLLTERRNILKLLIERTKMLLEQLTMHLRQDQEKIIKKQERIVLYDETVVPSDAQRRAAELRGIVGPGIPKKVETEIIIDAVPPPANTEVRSRGEVIGETRNDLGVVVPVETKVLSPGDTHDDIYRLQVFLNENGYTIAHEGPGSPGNESPVFGPATERALKIFQLINGIPVTGNLDKATRDIILTYVSSF